jgi:hypothetical protein
MELNIIPVSKKEMGPIVLKNFPDRFKIQYEP